MHIPIPKISTAVLLVVTGMFFAVLANTLFSVSVTSSEISNFRLRLGMLSGEIFLIIPVLIYLLLKRYPLSQLFRLNKVSSKTVFSALLAGFGFIIILEELNILLQYLLTPPDWLENIDSVFKTAGIFDFVLMLSAAVLVASFVEECLFRGFLQQILEKRLRDTTKAVLYTSLFFALMHMNPWWAIQIYLVGVFLGYITWRTNSVIPAIFVHLLNNLSSVLLTRAGDEPSWLYTGNHISPLFLIIGIFALYTGGKSFMHHALNDRIQYPHYFVEEK